MNVNFLIAGALVLLLALTHGLAWVQGGRAVQAEADRARLAAVSRAIAQADAIRAEDAAVLATRAVERTQTREVIRYVQRAAPVVSTPDCADLGPEWVSLFNAAVHAANGDAGAAASAVAAGGDGDGDAP